MAEQSGSGLSLSTRVLSRLWALPDPVASGGAWRRVLAWVVGATTLGAFVYFVGSQGVSAVLGVPPCSLVVVAVAAWTVYLVGLVRRVARDGRGSSGGSTDGQHIR